MIEAGPEGGAPMTDPRYPIGRFDAGVEPAAAEVEAAVRDIAELPERLREALDGLTEEQIDSPYREGGWTIRQLVHHVADSHLNAFIRLRLGLTEDTPRILTYKQDLWAELADSRTLPVDVSVQILTGLHRRWATLLESLGPGDFERRIDHPDHGEISLARLTALYGWHGRHHVAHVTAAPRGMAA
jgi:hypothetical protein